MRPDRFERTTFGFEGRRSIQLSYGRQLRRLCRQLPLRTKRYEAWRRSMTPAISAGAPRAASAPRDGSLRGGRGHIGRAKSTTGDGGLAIGVNHGGGISLPHGERRRFVDDLASHVPETPGAIERLPS